MRTYFPGEEKLIHQAKIGFPKSVTKVCENVYFFLGYGGSTCTLVVGETSCLLIDTLNGMTVAEEALLEMKKITDKPIKNIIYTHYHHFDHTSGASAFVEHNPEIIGRKPSYAQYDHTNLINKISGMRGARQFGLGLSPEEVISVGIGPRNQQNGKHGSLPCTKLITEEVVHMNFEGIEATLVAAPGETDDQIFIWLPQYGVLCCGDNYYESWPNLYAVRGSQYRDVSAWVDALSDMLTYEPTYLLPGHTKAVIGKETVKETLTNFRDALEYILLETLKGMDEGKGVDQLAEEIALPEHLAKLPYLQEYYGTVRWSVRAIYTGYLGWFDGNPTALSSMPIKEKAEKNIAMMGGSEKILTEIRTSIDHEQEQWAVELCDILLNADVEVEKAKMLKGEGLILLGRMQTSANARHYYIAYGKMLQGTFQPTNMKGAAADNNKK